MLNPNAKLWVEALRSGKYKQVTDALENRHGQCCLGVACRVAIDNGLALRVNADGAVTYFGDDTAELPRAVKEWLGLATSYGRFDDLTSLVALNDNGSSFDMIADIIESEPEGLFKAEAGQ